MSTSAPLWETLQKRYDELNELVMSSTLENAKRHLVQKEISYLSTLLTQHQKLTSLEQERTQLLSQREQNSDPEMATLFQEELDTLDTRITTETQELDNLMYPADPLNNRSVFLEVRAGTPNNWEKLAIAVYTMPRRRGQSFVDVIPFSGDQTSPRSHGSGNSDDTSSGSHHSSDSSSTRKERQERKEQRALAKQQKREEKEEKRLKSLSHAEAIAKHEFAWRAENEGTILHNASTLAEVTSILAELDKKSQDEQCAFLTVKNKNMQHTALMSAQHNFMLNTDSATLLKIMSTIRDNLTADFSARRYGLTSVSVERAKIIRAIYVQMKKAHCEIEEFKAPVIAHSDSNTD